MEFIFKPEVSSSKPEVSSSEAQVPSSKLEVPSSEAQVSSSEAQVSSSEAQVSSSEVEVPSSKAIVFLIYFNKTNKNNFNIITADFTMTERHRPPILIPIQLMIATHPWVKTR